ncbi:hypothetical protein [Streptomyces sp. NPDC003023]|uniref:hypothetical protein n=1 Tax=Streptomyces sp. NPDC003023 TaxID=3364675 RepID=UPI0036CC379A
MPPGGVRMRPALPGDAEALCAAHVDNRDHLAPWEPRRAEEFFTVDGQARRIDGAWRDHRLFQRILHDRPPHL